VALQRSPYRWIPTVAILTTIVLPAIAVSTASASAGSGHSQAMTYVQADDSNIVKIATNDEQRLDGLKSGPAIDAKPAPLTAAEIQRASRSLVRKALTAPVYVRPVPGPVTQWYGTHPGIDIAPPYGTPIGAAHSGVVTFVGWDDGYGMHVEVAQVDGYVTTYSHMSAWTVKVGQLVVAGQQLGNVGSTGYSTGPHLHFEVHLPGGARMDPAVWLREHGVAV
jgi:murein DD-endopeptidase MepM/ murein hydrolase activator NlpD